jgi:hypothetical protein
VLAFRQRVAKLLFLGIVKGCLEHGAARVLNLPQHLVGVMFLMSTNSAALPGCMLVESSFMKASSMP